MIYREVKGTNIPALGFGTYRMSGDECAEAVRHALEIGYRHIDTAQAYDNEEDVARGIGASGVPRGEIFLTTKVWWQNWNYEEALDSAHQSLERLGTDYVDLLLIHWPHPEEPIDEPLDALNQTKAEGTARLIGVSNFTPALLAKAVDKAPLVCNQVEYHPFLDQQSMLASMRQYGMLLVAYSPIARGNVNQERALQEIAEKYGKTPAQVTLRWHIQQDRVAAIPKASKPEHRESNFQIFDFELTDGEMAKIFGLEREERMVDPDFAPAWRR